MNLDELIKRLLEIRREYGNLPEIYIGVETPQEYVSLELSEIEVEERRTLYLWADEDA